MRVVSWIVVIVSIGWLMAFNLGLSHGVGGIPEVNMNQVAGTISAAHSQAVNHGFEDFARRYTEAWNSHDPARVAEFYATDGSITINGNDPHRGTVALVAMVDSYIAEFPDIELSMDGLEALDGRQVYHWSFTGTHSGTGNRVRIHGSETWRFNDEGLIAESIGQYDANEYALQVAEGYPH